MPPLIKTSGRSKEGQFQRRPFFRLNVIPLFVPPLRERKEDIPILVEYFLDSLAEEYGKPPRKILPAALKYLQSYDWPGMSENLRMS